MICGYDNNTYNQGRIDAINELEASLTQEMRDWYKDTNIQRGKRNPNVIDVMIDLAIRTVYKFSNKMREETNESSDRL